MKRFLSIDVLVVIRLIEDGNLDTISNRPKSICFFNSLGVLCHIPLAGLIITGWVPCSKIRRHSFSIGEWKPLITDLPSFRHFRQKSYVFIISSPGHLTEQNRATGLVFSKFELPNVYNWDWLYINTAGETLNFLAST